MSEKLTTEGLRAGAITIDIVDHLAAEPHGPTVLAGLGAAVVVELARFDVTIEKFVETLRMLKRERDAEIARHKGDKGDN